MKSFSIISRQDELSNLRKEQIKSALETRFIYDETHPDLVISIGGDGTMLDAVHRYIDDLDHVYFVGVHSGTLGFYTDYNEDEWDILVRDIFNSDYMIDKQCMLEVISDGHHLFALNEMRLEENHHTFVCEVRINNEYLETFRGNGLCISTPSGSTALNRSLGGSIVASSIPSLQLTEIAGIHHNAYRSLQSSIVLDASTVISLLPQNSKSMILGIDRMVIPFEKENGTLHVCVSKKQVQFIRYRHRGLVQRLRKAFINE